MMVNVTFDNQYVQALCDRAQELVKELREVSMKLNMAMDIKAEEKPTSGN